MTVSASIQSPQNNSMDNMCRIPHYKSSVSGSARTAPRMTTSPRDIAEIVLLSLDFTYLTKFSSSICDHG